jgi:hypothetical protein
VTEEAPAPKKRGRPSHEPTEITRRLVTWAAFKHATQDEIAKIIGINDETLRIHYAEEIGVEKELKGTYLLEAGYLMGVGGPDRDWEKADPSMNRFMQEKFCGVSSTTKVEISGSLETKGSEAREFIVGRIAGITAALRPIEDPSGTDGSAG